jgi:hypothetical protein
MSTWFQYSPMVNGTYYQVYMLYSDENPFDTAVFGKMLKWNLTQEVPKATAILVWGLALGLALLG